MSIGDDQSNNTYEFTTNYNNTEIDPKSIFYWNELIPTLVVYGTTFVLGLIGNVLMIFTTYRFRRMQNVTNVLLASLASCDLLLIIICIPVKVAKLFSYTWNLGEVVCKSVHYMQNVAAICSVFTLTAISIERYYAIIHPMKARYICTISQTKMIIFFVWIISFVLGTPTLYVQIHMRVGERKEDFWCVKNWDNPFIWKLHELYFLFFILIGPFTIMSICYLLICLEVWKVMERRSVMTNNPPYEFALISLRHTNRNTIEIVRYFETVHKNARDDTKMVKQVIYMLVAVVFFFAICWTPLLIDNVLTAFDVLPILRGDSLKYMSTAFHLLAYFNSCLNPIIYGFMSKHFRECFQKLCCGCFSRNRRHFRGSSNNCSLRQISRTGSQTKNTSIR